MTEIAIAKKTIPLEMPTVEIFENAGFLTEQIGGLTKDGVLCEISRSLSGMTLFVNRKGDRERMAVLDLRPILTGMAELLIKENG